MRAALPTALARTQGSDGAIRRLIALALLAGGVVAATGPAPESPTQAAAAFPWQRVGVDAAQLAALERGTPVVKVLDTRNQRDVAVFGIIRVGVSRDAYEARMVDFTTSLAAPTRPRFGIFHDPAVASDVADAVISRNEVDDARTCRPGKCKFKLPATEMQRISAGIDWSPGADPSGQLNRYLRQRLVEFATDYRTRGDSAMLVYDDVRGVHASDAFADLLEQVRQIYDDIPSLRKYFATYPHATLAGGHDVLFWAQDSMPGLKSVLAVTHEIVYQPPEFAGVTLMAAKEIYAGHYFEAAFDLTAILDHPARSESPGVYLVVLRLMRFDNLSSGPIVSVRGKVIGKLRNQLRADLERQKANAERER